VLALDFLVLLDAMLQVVLKVDLDHRHCVQFDVLVEGFSLLFEHFFLD
jgi:hypothetical protein